LYRRFLANHGGQETMLTANKQIILMVGGLFVTASLFWFASIVEAHALTGIFYALGGAVLALGATITWITLSARRLSEAGRDVIREVLNKGTGLVPVSVVASLLEAAKEHERTNASAQLRDLKASALSETSAAMMLADEKFKITFVNDATLKLLTENEANIQKAVPNFCAEKIVGQPMDVFHSGGNRARKYLSDPSNLPYETDIQVGPLWFSLKIVSAKNAEGRPSGFVVEWNEVTELRRNRAIRDTLETGQVLCELTPEGQFDRANANFLNLMEQTNTSNLSFATALVPDESGSTPDWAAIGAGQASFGRYAFRGKSGRTVWIDASFSAVRDQSGAVMSVLLIGHDVTEEENARREARAERERSQAEVQHVVEALRNALSELAEGNLTAQLNTPFAPDYEPIRHSFNAALQELGSAVSFAVATVSTLGRTSGTISDSTLSLSKTTEQQAAALEQTAAALNEMTASVKSAASNAESAKTQAADTKNLALESGDVVKKAVEAMRAIEESSEKITKIISVIDDISFQTNLLALNAGVEAARAGDAGRGFAVVASEVRGLAQRSADSATEIKKLIDESTRSVDTGAELVTKTGEALQKIIDAMQSVDVKVAEIASSSAEQSTGLNEINLAVTQLGNNNQEFAASFEETTAATQDMAADVDVLQSRMSKFRLNDQPKLSITPKPDVRHQEKPVAMQVEEAPLKVVGGRNDGWEEF
jgi:methyl-accepting chemotaxis protein